MTFRLGQIAPDFEQGTTQGRRRFHDWLDGHWGVLFSHSKDFTPVCTTELGETDRHKLSTPVNWRPGDRAIIVPSVSDEDAKTMFPQGWETKKPYLRLVDVPQE